MRMMMTCPSTQQPIFTGMNLDKISFDGMTITNSQVNCASCGQRHPLNKKDLYPETTGADGF